MNLNLINADNCTIADGFKCVYVLKSSNGNVKIGVSADVKKRKSFFTSGSGYEIVDYRFTKPCSNAFMLEKQIHKYFENYRLKGEWFSCTFEEALEYVENLFLDFARFEKKEDHTVENLMSLTGIEQIDDELEFKTSAGEVSSLIKNVRIAMERQNSTAVKIARQTELLLRHFGLPVIEGFVESESAWEQLQMNEM